MPWYTDMNQQLLTSGNWRSHQLAVQTMIEESLLHLNQRHVALILGAGNCRDIPLNMLLDAFQKVILVDIDEVTIEHVSHHHRTQNLILVGCDITRMHDWILAQDVRQHISPIEQQAVENIWSQYALPGDWMSTPLAG